MAVVKSSYPLLAKLKARYELEKNKYDVGVIIRFRYKRTERKKEKLKEIYNYIPAVHTRFYSPHSIVRDRGCGCKLCEAQHEYARAKLHLHYLKKSFYSDYGIDSLMTFGERRFPVEDNFYALYSEYSTHSPKNTLLSEADFFNKIYSERKQKVKDLRSKYRAIQATIQHILAE